MKTEKVYITRDEGDNWIWFWRKPSKGIWGPQKLKDCDIVNWQRPDRSLEGTQPYLAEDFKKKFGIMIRMKTKKCVYLSKDLLDNDEYRLFTESHKKGKKK